MKTDPMIRSTVNYSKLSSERTRVGCVLTQSVYIVTSVPVSFLMEDFPIALIWMVFFRLGNDRCLCWWSQIPKWRRGDIWSNSELVFHPSSRWMVPVQLGAYKLADAAILARLFVRRMRWSDVKSRGTKKCSYFRSVKL